MKGDQMTGARKILVVDDYRSMRYFCSHVLEGAGYKVELASDGLEALKKLTSAHFDLVVTDIDMPNVDGISLYNNAVRLDPAWKNGFVFMTGGSTDNIWFETNGLKKICLSKPFAISDLLGCVEKTLAGADEGKKEEKRLEERFCPASGSRVLVEDAQNHEIMLANAADLSLHGLKVECKTGAFREGSEINLCMYFNYLCLTREARVVWSKNNGERGSVAGLYLPSPFPELSMSEREAEYGYHGHAPVTSPA